MVMENDRYGYFDFYNYSIKNLEIGDILTIEYAYEVEYLNNLYLLSSFRIFFNNNFNTEIYSLTISHNNNLNANIIYLNNGKPDSISTVEQTKHYYWSEKDLAGCINEEGAIPYLSLPHINISIYPSDFYYFPPNSLASSRLPLYYNYVQLREKNHLAIITAINQGVNTNQYNQLNKFVDENILSIENDNTGYIKLLKLHSKIVDDFDFANDLEYFNNRDTRDPRIGDYITKRTIRDISRYDLYIALLRKLDLNHLTAYIVDNRVGELSMSYVSPMFDSDYLIATTLKNNTLQYIYPKKNKFGYYLNELPFYFENSKATLVHLSDYMSADYPINENLKDITTPNSAIEENIRKNDAYVKINLDNSFVEFKVSVKLEGQYSTLCRGSYLYDYTDESINPNYGRKIWELESETELISTNTKVITKVFPYTTVVSAHFKNRNILTSNNDTLALDIKNWFNHIIYDDLNIENRKLDFHADFNGQDTYTYTIKFDENVEVISALDKLNINNDFGNLAIAIEQVDEKTIKLSSSFTTTNKKVRTENISEVKYIFDNIDELNNSKLLLILKK